MAAHPAAGPFSKSKSGFEENGAFDYSSTDANVLFSRSGLVLLTATMFPQVAMVHPIANRLEEPLETKCFAALTSAQHDWLACLEHFVDNQRS
jgi:hypothetical protein